MSCNFNYTTYLRDTTPSIIVAAIANTSICADLYFTQLEGAVIGVEFRQRWAELQNILERQKAKGGIIDTEAESNRFLIHINEVRKQGGA